MERLFSEGINTMSATTCPQYTRLLGIATGHGASGAKC
jgi:hypothetical protein